MSAGAFVLTRYQASYQGGLPVHPIRVQPETTGAFTDASINLPPADDATNPISAIATGSRRGLGLRARFIRIKLLGAPPTGYVENSVSRIVCLTVAFYESAALRGTVVNYLGTTWTVTGFQPETIA